MDPGTESPSESGTSVSKAMQSVSDKDDRELIPVMENQGLDLSIEISPSDPECRSVEQVDLLSGMLNDQVEAPAKEVMSPKTNEGKPQQNQELEDVKNRLNSMEGLFGDVLEHLRNIQKDQKEALRPPCISPSMSPPPTPVKTRVEEYEEWQKQMEQQQKQFENQQWVKPQPIRFGTMDKDFCLLEEKPFQGLNPEHAADDRQSVSWSATGSQLCGNLDQYLKLENADKIVDKDVKLLKLDISDSTTRALKFMLWLRDAKTKIPRLSRVARPLWELIVKVAKETYMRYLEATPEQRALIAPPNLENPGYAQTRDYLGPIVRDALNKELSESLLMKDATSPEETLYQLMIRVSPGGQAEVRGLLHFLEHPVPCDVATNKYKFPLTYKQAYDLLEKWEQCRLRTLELKQPLPSPSALWPAVQLIMERVLILSEQFRFKVLSHQGEMDINENPDYAKINAMRNMFAIYCNQQIEDARVASVGPRGYAPDKQPKGGGKTKDKSKPQQNDGSHALKALQQQIDELKKGKGNTPPSVNTPKQQDDKSQFNLSKMTVPGLDVKYPDAPLIVRKHVESESKRLCVVHAESKSGLGDKFKPEGAKLCKAFGTDEGCPYGGKCIFYHPLPYPKDGKCFNCGKVGCTVNTCERPKGPVIEKGKGKGKGKKGKGKEGDKGGKDKSKGPKTDDDQKKSLLNLVKGDSGVEGKMLMDQLEKFCKNKGTDLKALCMLQVEEDSESGINATITEADENGINTTFLKLPWTSKEHDVQLRNITAETDWDCLLDTGCTNAAADRPESLIFRKVWVTLADGVKKELGFTQGETIVVKKGSMMLYPPNKGDFYLGVAFGITGGKTKLWHPIYGYLKVKCPKGSPCTTRLIGERLIFELEMAIIHYRKTGECAFTKNYPGGIVGFAPPIKDLTKTEPELIQEEEQNCGNVEVSAMAIELQKSEDDESECQPSKGSEIVEKKGEKTRLIVDAAKQEINFQDVSSKEKESLDDLIRQSNELLESETAGEIAIQLSECAEQAQAAAQSINDDVQQADLQHEGKDNTPEEDVPELEDGVIIDGVWLSKAEVEENEKALKTLAKEKELIPQGITHVNICKHCKNFDLCDDVICTLCGVRMTPHNLVDKMLAVNCQYSYMDESDPNLYGKLPHKKMDVMTIFENEEGGTIFRRLDVGVNNFQPLPIKLALMWPQVHVIKTCTPEGLVIRMVYVERNHHRNEGEEVKYLQTQRRKTKRKPKRSIKTSEKNEEEKWSVIQANTLEVIEEFEPDVHSDNEVSSSSSSEVSSGSYEFVDLNTMDEYNMTSVNACSVELMPHDYAFEHVETQKRTYGQNDLEKLREMVRYLGNSKEEIKEEMRKLSIKALLEKHPAVTEMNDYQEIDRVLICQSIEGFKFPHWKFEVKTLRWVLLIPAGFMQYLKDTGTPIPNEGDIPEICELENIRLNLNITGPRGRERGRKVTIVQFNSEWMKHKQVIDMDPTRIGLPWSLMASDVHAAHVSFSWPDSSSEEESEDEYKPDEELNTSGEEKPVEDLFSEQVVDAMASQLVLESSQNHKNGYRTLFKLFKNEHPETQGTQGELDYISFKRCQRSMRLCKARVGSAATMTETVETVLNMDVFSTVPTSAKNLALRNVFETPPRVLPFGSIVILYDGELDGESLGEELKVRYPQIAHLIHAFDIKRSNPEDRKRNDIFGYLWSTLLHSMYQGRIAGILAGPNCKSWSILLHRYKPGFPTPRRARHDPWVAIKDLDQDDLDKESNLLLRVLILLLIGKYKGFKVFFGLEHPEDPEKNPLIKKRWLTEQEASTPCCSFWATKVFEEVKKILGGSLQSFDQGALGHETKKPTSFWTDLMVSLEGIRKFGKQNTAYDLKSEKLARWAPGFRDAVAVAIGDLIPDTLKLSSKTEGIEIEEVECANREALYREIPDGPMNIKVQFFDQEGVILCEREVKESIRFVTLPKTQQEKWKRVKEIKTFNEKGELIRHVKIPRGSDQLLPTPRVEPMAAAVKVRVSSKKGPEALYKKEPSEPLPPIEEEGVAEQPLEAQEVDPAQRAAMDPVYLNDGDLMWLEHCASGHLVYKRSCYHCIRGALRTRRHVRIAAEDRETNVLAIDTTGPFVNGWQLVSPAKPLKMKYVLCGAFRYTPTADLNVHDDPIDNVEKSGEPVVIDEPAVKSRQPRRRQKKEVNSEKQQQEEVEPEHSEPPLDPEFEELINNLGCRATVDSEKPGEGSELKKPGVNDPERQEVYAHGSFLENGDPWIPTVEKEEGSFFLNAVEHDPESTDKEDEEIKSLMEKIKVIDNGATVKIVAVWPMFIPMASRGNAHTLDAISEMVSRIRRSGRTVKRLHCDQAREYLSYPIKRWLKDQGIWLTYNAGDDPQNNGLAEAAVGICKNKTITVLSCSKLEHKHWPYAVKHVDYQYIRKHSDLIKPCALDKLVFGQKVMVKCRKWKKMQSSFLPKTEEVYYLGRDERLSGEGGLMLAMNGNIRHGTTFVDVTEGPPPPVRNLEAQMLPEGTIQLKDKVPMYKIKGKTPRDLVHMKYCAVDFYQHPGEFIAEMLENVPDDDSSLNMKMAQVGLPSLKVAGVKTSEMLDEVLRLCKIITETPKINEWYKSTPMPEDDWEEWIMLKKAIVNPFKKGLDVEKALSPESPGVQVTETIPLTEVKRNLHLWKESMQAELDSLVEKEAIVRVPPHLVQKLLQDNPNAKLLPAKGVFVVKPPKKVKSRAVACGNFNTGPQLDKSEIYSGGIEVTSLRVGLRLSALNGWEVGTTDVSTAFLNALLKLDYLILLWAPNVFAEAGVTDFGEVWIVRKAIYGLREAPRAWGDERDAKLRPLRVVHNGMVYRLRQCTTDPSLWRIEKAPWELLATKFPKNRTWVYLRRIKSFLEPQLDGYLITYVDDILVSSEEALVKAVLNKIKLIWTCSDGECTYSHESVTFCSLKITKLKNGSYFCDQNPYVMDVVDRYELTCGKALKVPIQHDESVLTGTAKATEDAEVARLAALPPELRLQEKSVKLAQTIAGEILWVSGRSRPDIAYATSRCCSLATIEPDRSLRIGKQIVRYLINTPEHGLFYSSTPSLKTYGRKFQRAYPDVVPFEELYRVNSIVSFTDASYAPAATNEVSVGGFMLMVAGGVVSWRASKVALACVSTAEAELQAAQDGFVGTLSVRALMAELRLANFNVWLAVDNKPCVQLLVSTSQTSWRTRHLRIKADTIVQAKNEGLITLRHVPGEVELADMLTKAVPAGRVQLLRAMSGILHREEAVLMDSEGPDFNISRDSEGPDVNIGNLDPAQAAGAVIQVDSSTAYQLMVDQVVEDLALRMMISEEGLIPSDGPEELIPAGPQVGVIPENPFAEIRGRDLRSDRSIVAFHERIYEVTQRYNLFGINSDLGERLAKQEKEMFNHDFWRRAQSCPPGINPELREDPHRVKTGINPIPYTDSEKEELRHILGSTRTCGFWLPTDDLPTSNLTEELVEEGRRLGLWHQNVDQLRDRGIYIPVSNANSRPVGDLNTQETNETNQEPEETPEDEPLLVEELSLPFRFVDGRVVPVSPRSAEDTSDSQRQIDAIVNRHVLGQVGTLLDDHRSELNHTRYWDTRHRTEGSIGLANLTGSLAVEVALNHGLITETNRLSPTSTPESDDTVRALIPDHLNTSIPTAQEQKQSQGGVASSSHQTLALTVVRDENSNNTVINHERQEVGINEPVYNEPIDYNGGRKCENDGCERCGKVCKYAALGISHPFALEECRCDEYPNCADPRFPNGIICPGGTCSNCKQECFWTGRRHMYGVKRCMCEYYPCCCRREPCPNCGEECKWYALKHPAGFDYCQCKDYPNCNSGRVWPNPYASWGDFTKEEAGLRSDESSDEESRASSVDHVMEAAQINLSDMLNEEKYGCADRCYICGFGCAIQARMKERGFTATHAPPCKCHLAPNCRVSDVEMEFKRSKKERMDSRKQALMLTKAWNRGKRNSRAQQALMPSSSSHEVPPWTVLYSQAQEDASVEIDQEVQQEFQATNEELIPSEIPIPQWAGEIEPMRIQPEQTECFDCGGRIKSGLRCPECRMPSCPFHRMKHYCHKCGKYVCSEWKSHGGADCESTGFNDRDEDRRDSLLNKQIQRYVTGEFRLAMMQVDESRSSQGSKKVELTPSDECKDEYEAWRNRSVMVKPCKDSSGLTCPAYVNQPHKIARRLDPWTDSESDRAALRELLAQSRVRLKHSKRKDSESGTDSKGSVISGDVNSSDSTIPPWRTSEPRVVSPPEKGDLIVTPKPISMTKRGFKEQEGQNYKGTQGYYAMAWGSHRRGGHGGGERRNDDGLNHQMQGHWGWYTPNYQRQDQYQGQGWNTWETDRQVYVTDRNQQFIRSQTWGGNLAANELPRPGEAYYQGHDPRGLSLHLPTNISQQAYDVSQTQLLSNQVRINPYVQQEAQQVPQPAATEGVNARIDSRFRGARCVVCGRPDHTSIHIDRGGDLPCGPDLNTVRYIIECRNRLNADHVQVDCMEVVWRELQDIGRYGWKFKIRHGQKKGELMYPTNSNGWVSVWDIARTGARFIQQIAEKSPGFFKASQQLFEHLASVEVTRTAEVGKPRIQIDGRFPNQPGASVDPLRIRAISGQTYVGFKTLGDNYVVQNDLRGGSFYHLTTLKSAAMICETKVMVPAAMLTGSGKKQLHITRNVGDARPFDMVAFQIKLESPHPKSAEADFFTPLHKRFQETTKLPDLNAQHPSQALRLETYNGTDTSGWFFTVEPISLAYVTTIAVFNTTSRVQLKKLLEKLKPPEFAQHCLGLVKQFNLRECRDARKELLESMRKQHTGVLNPLAVPVRCEDPDAPVKDDAQKRCPPNPGKPPGEGNTMGLRDNKGELTTPKKENDPNYDQGRIKVDSCELCGSWLHASEDCPLNKWGCWNCGSTWHTVKECKHGNLVGCFTCGNRKHFYTQCYWHQRWRNAQLQNVTSEEGKEEFKPRRQRSPSRSPRRSRSADARSSWKSNAALKAERKEQHWQRHKAEEAASSWEKAGLKPGEQPDTSSGRFTEDHKKKTYGQYHFKGVPGAADESVKRLPKAESEASRLLYRTRLCKFFFSWKGCQRCNSERSWCNHAHSMAELSPSIYSIPEDANTDAINKWADAIAEGEMWICGGTKANKDVHKEIPLDTPKCHLCGLTYWQAELIRMKDEEEQTGKAIKSRYKLVMCKSLGRVPPEDENAFERCMKYCRRGFQCRFAHSQEELDDCYEVLKKGIKPLESSWTNAEEDVTWSDDGTEESMSFDESSSEDSQDSMAGDPNSTWSRLSHLGVINETNRKKRFKARVKKEKEQDDEKTMDVNVCKTESMKTSDGFVKIESMGEDEYKEEYQKRQDALSDAQTVLEKAMTSLQVARSGGEPQESLDKLEAAVNRCSFGVEKALKAFTAMAMVSRAEAGPSDGAVASAYIKCAPFSLASIIGTYVGIGVQDEHDTHVRCQKCWYEELIPNMQDVCWSTEVEDMSVSWELDVEEHVICGCKDMLKCQDQNVSWQWIQMGFALLMCSLALYMIVEALRRVIRLDLSLSNPVRACEDRRCVLGNTPQDADVIIIEGNVKPLCCFCMGIEEIVTENLQLIAIRSHRLRPCSVCGIMSVYTCIHCGEHLCFSLFHSQDDTYCYDHHSLICGQEGSELPLNIRYKLICAKINRWFEINVVSTAKIWVTFGDVQRYVIQEGYNQGIKLIESVEVLILYCLQEIKEEFDGSGYKYVKEKLTNWKGELTGKALKDTILKCIGSCLNTAMTIFVLLACESVQDVLEILTLAGDRGVAPGTVSMIVSSFTYLMNGPFISVGTLCWIGVLVLKASEGVEINNHPITPKKVIERNLEGYSPLNGVANIHTLDHDLEEEPCITIKRIKAFGFFMIVAYIAISVQGCLLVASEIVAVEAMDESTGIKVLIDDVSTWVITLGVVLMTTCWIASCYCCKPSKEPELIQPEKPKDTTESVPEQKIGRNKMDAIIQFRQIPHDDWDPLGLTKRCRVIQYDSLRRLTVCSQPHCPNSDFCNVHKDWKGNVGMPFEPTMGTLGVNPADVSYEVGWILLENEQRKVWRKKLPYINNAPLKKMCEALGIDVLGINSPKYKNEMVIRLLQVIKHPNFVKVVTYFIHEEKTRQLKLTPDDVLG